jgi:hypothetical protein
MDARVQQDFHVYESHGNSFEDSARFTLLSRMAWHILRQVKIRPQHGFWGGQVSGCGARGGAADVLPEAITISERRARVQPTGRESHRRVAGFITVGVRN